jgi:hypothetical protein
VRRWRLEVAGLWLRISQLSSVVGAGLRASERANVQLSLKAKIPLCLLSLRSRLLVRGVDCDCASRGHSYLSAPGRLVSVVFTGFRVRTRPADTSAGVRGLQQSTDARLASAMTSVVSSYNVLSSPSWRQSVSACA